jgi:hypothetical protein
MGMGYWVRNGLSMVADWKVEKSTPVIEAIR